MAKISERNGKRGPVAAPAESASLRVRATTVLLLLSLALACVVAPAGALAQGGAGDASVVGRAPSELPEQTERHIPLFWLILMTTAFAFWLGVYGFVSRHAGAHYLNQKLWNSLILGVGAVTITLALLVYSIFLILCLIGSGIVLASYIVYHNKRVPADKRLFTGRHLSYALRHALSRLGIKIRQPATSQQDVQVQIVLTRKDGQTLESLGREVARGENEPNVPLTVKQIVEGAVRSRATDIHIEPGPEEVNVRFRIDGILHSINPLPGQLGPPIISMIKVLSDMDIAEKRKPQDGSFSGELEGRNLDFRAATSGTVHGETMALRILDRDRDLINLDQIGMAPKMRSRFQEAVNAPHGMVIVCGPTGSGKTTTLYAALLEMDVYQKNIMTIENPIEYRLDNISQTAVNPKAGITFAGMLRSLLRQDPNVLMVGEIRDAETAKVALQAAMTGHLVLTTLHANDTVVSLFRLLDLGVEPYLLASSLSCILAQRLVRKLCKYCRVPYTPDPELLRKLGLKVAEDQVFYKAQGCETCHGTGYYGRVGVFEMLMINDSLSDLIRENPSIQAIKAEARKAGMRTLHQHGLIKVVHGVTSVEELARVTK